MVENKPTDPEIVDFGAGEETPKKDKKKVNIFDDFNDDSVLKEEIGKTLEKLDRDVFFYISLLTKIFQIFFFLLFFIVIIGTIYIFIQKNESISSQSFLDPVCTILNGEIDSPEANCSSITYVNKYYKKIVEKEKEDQTKSILGILPKLYQENNFENSKEVSFLLDKSEDRLQVLEILSKFDELKNNFTGLEKGKIVCSDFTIQSDDRTISAQCRAYSRGYESSIRGFSGEEKNVRGTSLSVANSFLNFIEKTSDYFSLLDRQKIFSAEVFMDSSSGYDTQTKFDLTLKINN